MTLVTSANGARFFVNVVFPIFSDDEDEACRFAKDDDVDDENDERRLIWVDIVVQNKFTLWVQEAIFPLSGSPFFVSSRTRKKAG